MANARVHWPAEAGEPRRSGSGATTGWASLEQSGYLGSRGTERNADEKP